MKHKVCNTTNYTTQDVIYLYHHVRNARMRWTYMLPSYLSIRSHLTKMKMKNQLTFQVYESNNNLRTRSRVEEIHRQIPDLEHSDTRTHVRRHLSAREPQSIFKSSVLHGIREIMRFFFFFFDPHFPSTGS